MDQPSFTTPNFFPQIFVWCHRARSFYRVVTIWPSSGTWLVHTHSLMEQPAAQSRIAGAAHSQERLLENSNNKLASEIQGRINKSGLSAHIFYKKCCIALILNHCSIVWVAFNNKTVAFSLQWVQLMWCGQTISAKNISCHTSQRSFFPQFLIFYAVSTELCWCPHPICYAFRKGYSKEVFYLYFSYASPYTKFIMNTVLSCWSIK